MRRARSAPTLSTRRPRGNYLVALGILLVAAAALLVVRSHAAESPAAQEAAIPCSVSEMNVEHVHAHVSLLVRGEERMIPANIGIRSNCLFWLHIHDASGVIHVEAGAGGQYILGQFFSVWGQPLSSIQLLDAQVRPGEEVRIIVNGSPASGDPRDVVLAAHADIVIELGPPFPTPTPFSFPPGL